MDVIIEATARILAKEGAEALTTNRIAEVAGVSVGSLYQYFPNKESIVAALRDSRVEGSRSLIETLPPVRSISLAGLVRERVTVFTQMALDTIRFPLELSKFELPAPKDALVRETVTEQFHCILDANRAELVVEDVKLAAAVCSATLRGVLVAAREAKIQEPPERIIGELTTLLLRYVTGRDP